ncbi:MAG: AAA family ATPase [Nanoarchaeota archaeon]
MKKEYLVKLPLALHLTTNKKSFFLNEKFEAIAVNNVEKLLDYHINNIDIINLTPEFKDSTDYKIGDAIQEEDPEAYKDFFHYVLHNELPSAEQIENKNIKYENIAGVNDNILKNLAIYLFKSGLTEKDIELQLKAHYEEKGWPFAQLKGWFKKVVNRDITEINKGELIEWCLMYKKELLAKIPEISGLDEISKLEREIIRLTEDKLRRQLSKFLKRIIDLRNEVFERYFFGLLAVKTKISKIEIERITNNLIALEDSKPPVAFSELMNKELSPIEYIIYPIIPKNKLILIGGKPGKFKSMFALALSLSMQKDYMFLDVFKSLESPKILYYDLENDEITTLWRAKYLKNGLKISDDKLKNIHLVNKFDKNNINKEIELAKNYDVIILDSYRRFLKGEENTSEVTDKFFSSFLKPLKDKYKKTLIIIHHFKKGNLEEFDDDMVIDIFRGSSDIPAQFDLIYGIIKHEDDDEKEDNLNFDISVMKVKNRLGLPIKNFVFNVNKNDATQSTEIRFKKTFKFSSPKDNHKQKIIDFIALKTNPTRDEIFENCKNKYNLSLRTVARYLKELLEENKIIQPEYSKYSLQL